MKGIKLQMRKDFELNNNEYIIYKSLMMWLSAFQKEIYISKGMYYKKVLKTSKICIRSIIKDKKNMKKYEGGNKNKKLMTNKG